MRRPMWKSKKRTAKLEKGQILILVTLAIVGIVAVVGLSLDVGMVFIENARLRRGVDAAALAAALQYREGYTIDGLERSAVEFLRLNGVTDPNAIVQICGNSAQIAADPDHYSADLCTLPQRKLVRVRASAVVRLAFLPVIGIPTASISAEAVSETASVDVVLLIDTSESMAFDTEDGENLDQPLLDPSICNYDDRSAPYVDAADLNDGFPGECRPFEDVKKAAVFFVQQLYFPYDRVAIVTFDKDAIVVLPFSSDEMEIIGAIKNLKVYEGDRNEIAGGNDPICERALEPDGSLNGAILGGGNPCRRYTHVVVGGVPQYDSGGEPVLRYNAFDCPNYYTDPANKDPSECTSTNIGEGLMRGGQEFSRPPERLEAMWVVILLTDGAANTGRLDDGRRICPEETWTRSPLCRRTVSGPLEVKPRALIGSPDYDPDDFARDMADYVGRDQSAYIFAIGLGELVVNDYQAGEKLLQYAVDYAVGEGEYYYAPSGAELRIIFEKIASKIATRLAK